MDKRRSDKLPPAVHLPPLVLEGRKPVRKVAASRRGWAKVKERAFISALAESCNVKLAAPAVGSCYIVTATLSGAWTGHAGCLAGMTAAGWRFVTPVEGLAAFVRSNGLTAVYRVGAWDLGTLRGERVEIGGQQVVGLRGGAIFAPAAGTVIDAEARTTVSAILSALRLHGLIAS